MTVPRRILIVGGYGVAGRAVVRKAPDARRKVIAANVVGITDFAIALGTGLVTSDTVYRIYAEGAPNLVGEAPMVMIPAFFVPMFLAAHLLSVRKLMQTSDSTRPSLCEEA